MDSTRTARKWLIAFVILTGIADLATFLYFKEWHLFEINPIFVLGGSVTLLVLLKIAMLGVLSFTIWRGFAGRHANFMVVLGCLYIILFQGLGAYSNCQVAAAAPPASAALAPAKAVTTYAWVMVFNYFLPLLLGTLAYWVFDKAGYDDRAIKRIQIVKIVENKTGKKPWE